MNKTKNTTDHWIVRMNRRNRTWCAFLMFLTVGLHLLDKGIGALGWAVLAGQFLVYPQVIYWLAHRSPHPRLAELRNMDMDALCFGVWAAALGFPVWITFIFLVTMTVNLTVFHGRIGFARAVGFILLGSLCGLAVGGFHFSPETGWPATLLSILTVSLYVLVVADNAYARAVKLHETRARLETSERELKRQLEEIHALQLRLQEQADRDPLTGLYNRRYFDTTLARELHRCRRDGQPFCILMIDIDHFKQINDTYGHQAGDEVLKRLAGLLNDSVRASDVACRYGGEEFIVLLPGVPQDIAIERAGMWRTAFAAAPVRFDDIAVHATLSIGIAACPDHGVTPEALIRCADLALYHAKSTGRNRVISADPSLEHVMR